jgi:hypothetical protein
MKSDIEMIESIKAAAVCSIGDELAFAFPQVLGIIEQCSTNDMAVLGVEINKAIGERYQTEHNSTYEVPVPQSDLPEKEWKSYVRANNLLAERYVRQHPAGDEQFYLLAATSWREFCQIQAMKRKRV